MFKLHEIREIIKLVDQTSIQELELEEEGKRICIKKGGAVVSGQVVYQPPVQAVAPAHPVAENKPVVEKAAEPIAKPEPKPVVQAQPVEVADEAGLHKIVSPMVGTFYKAPEPGAAPYVKPGDKVQPNTVVCIVEAMKLFNEIEAEVSGEIVKVLVEDGQLVEYGQPLFLVKVE